MAEDLLEILKNFLVAPHWYPIVPVIGFIVIAAASAGLSSSDYTEEGAASGAAAWPAPMALSLGLLAIWSALGNYADGAASLIVYTVIAAICGIVASNRGRIIGITNNMGGFVSLIRDIIMLAVGIIATMLALELSWNTSFPALDPKCFLIELGLIAGIIIALYFLGQQSAAIIWPAVLLAVFAGTCQYFLAKFKGVAILPSDLLAMPTAFKVKEGYSFVLDSRGLWGPTAACIAFMAFSLIGGLPSQNDVVDVPRGRHATQAQLVGGPQDPKRRGERLRHALFVIARFGIGVGVAALVFFAMTGPNYIKSLGVTMDYSKSLDSYKKDGFFTGFVAAAQDFPISKPEGYSKTGATELQTALAESYESNVSSDSWRVKAVDQFTSKQPCIVVVMNESFADLSIFNGLGCDYKGPTYYKSVDTALYKGKLAVSVIGGGTCNTEFEILTGNNYGFVGGGKYPFMSYRMPRENLVQQLESLGYTTTAIHPNLATNWNRDIVYDTLGFDQFIDITAFEEAPQLHMGATDASTYDKILEILRTSAGPQFIFDVTMQNHGSYNLENIPEEQQVNYVPQGVPEDALTDEDVSALNEYLACIEASDADLKYFLDELMKVEQRVVVIFLGDHQPPFTPLYNDIFFADEEDQVAHQERVYQTEYFIWANYDVAGVAQKSANKDMSADMLGAVTLNLIGAPLSDYQKARIMERSSIFAVNAFGYLGADGVWYAPNDETSPYAQQYQELSYLNYLNFGSKV